MLVTLPLLHVEKNYCSVFLYYLMYILKAAGSLLLARRKEMPAIETVILIFLLGYTAPWTRHTNDHSPNLQLCAKWKASTVTEVTLARMTWQGFRQETEFELIFSNGQKFDREGEEKRTSQIVSEIGRNKVWSRNSK